MELTALHNEAGRKYIMIVGGGQKLEADHLGDAIPKILAGDSFEPEVSPEGPLSFTVLSYGEYLHWDLSCRV